MGDGGPGIAVSGEGELPIGSDGFGEVGGVRPGADQSSKAAFGKSTFAKTWFLLLKIRHSAHQSSKKQKCFQARFSTF